MRFRADVDLIQIDDAVLRRGDEVKRVLWLLNLRRNRAETLTRRIHLLFCALAAARVHRGDGWLSVGEIGGLDGWSTGGSVAKLLINEFELGGSAQGILEQHGRGADALLRIRMPAALVEIGDLPAGVRSLFVHRARSPAAAPPEDVLPRSVRQWDFAVDVAGALRTACRGRMLLLRPLYQGGGREVGNHSLVFGGLEFRALGSTPGRSAVRSVLVKLPVGLDAGKQLVIHQDTLDAEAGLLDERAGWPGLPVRVERADVGFGASVVAELQRKHAIGAGDAPVAMQAMVVALGPPGTVEAEPRMLRAVIDGSHAATRRLTRRDIHNVLLLAERLATLTRLLHRERRAHRHLSVDAIVLRYELGIIEDILAADLAASVATPPGHDELLFRDLFDLGRVLAHMITGWRLSEARQDFEPPFPGRDNIRNAVAGEGETVALLLFAVSRYLLESGPGEHVAGDEPATVGLLDQFLHEIQHIQMLHWSRARGVPERRVSPGTALDATSPGDAPLRSWPRSAADPVATRLVTLSHLVDLRTLQHWCERYITRLAWYESMPGPGETLGEEEVAAPSAKRCIAILQRGFGRSAAGEMWRYLWNAAPDEAVDNWVRVLRNYVTHWTRERRFDARHELHDGAAAERTSGLGDELERLVHKVAARPGAERELLIGWLDEFRLRVWDADDRARGAEPPAPSWPADDRPRPDDRLRSWMHAGALERLLRTQTPPTEKDLYNVEIALRGQSSPETVFWHILLARAWVAAAAYGVKPEVRDEESGWDKAMRTLLVAAGVAASRKLPFEMAATLAASAHLTHVALANVELRKQVVSQGADEDSVRVQAAECALTAADAYLWLDNAGRHCRSLLEAVSLLAGSAFAERLVQALQLLALARNQRLLDWQPSHIPESDSRDPANRRFERYEPAAARASQGGAAHEAPGPCRFTEIEQALFDDVQRSWLKVRKRSDPDDPGVALTQTHFSRLASGAADIVEAAAPHIELSGWGLLELARQEHEAPELARIIDLGCGPGDEAWRLARTGRHEVWAVDSPLWFAVSPPATDAAARGPRFLPIEPVELAARICAGAPPRDVPVQVDAVLLRCALDRVSRRDVLLAAAYQLLRPGGIVVAVDWVQTGTADRTTWSRLLNTVRFVDVETALGYRLLSEQAGFTGFRAWRSEEVARAAAAAGAGAFGSAPADDLQMHRFFQRRLEITRQKLEDEPTDARRSPYERAFLMRNKRDLEVLTALSAPRGCLDWMYWTARRSPEPPPST